VAELQVSGGDERAGREERRGRLGETRGILGCRMQLSAHELIGVSEEKERERRATFKAASERIWVWIEGEGAKMERLKQRSSREARGDEKRAGELQLATYCKH